MSPEVTNQIQMLIEKEGALYRSPKTSTSTATSPFSSTPNSPFPFSTSPVFFGKDAAEPDQLTALTNDLYLWQRTRVPAHLACDDHDTPRLPYPFTAIALANHGAMSEVAKVTPSYVLNFWVSLRLDALKANITTRLEQHKQQLARYQSSRIWRYFTKDHTQHYQAQLNAIDQLQYATDRLLAEPTHPDSFRMTENLLTHLTELEEQLNMVPLEHCVNAYYLHQPDEPFDPRRLIHNHSTGKRWWAQYNDDRREATQQLQQHDALLLTQAIASQPLLEMPSTEPLLSRYLSQRTEVVMALTIRLLFYDLLEGNDRVPLRLFKQVRKLFNRRNTTAFIRLFKTLPSNLKHSISQHLYLLHVSALSHSICATDWQTATLTQLMQLHNKIDLRQQLIQDDTNLIRGGDALQSLLLSEQVDCLLLQVQARLLYTWFQHEISKPTEGVLVSRFMMTQPDELYLLSKLRDQKNTVVHNFLNAILRFVRFEYDYQQNASAYMMDKWQQHFCALGEAQQQLLYDLIETLHQPTPESQQWLRDTTLEQAFSRYRRLRRVWNNFHAIKTPSLRNTRLKNIFQRSAQTEDVISELRHRWLLKQINYHFIYAAPVVMYEALKQHGPTALGVLRQLVGLAHQAWQHRQTGSLPQLHTALGSLFTVEQLRRHFSSSLIAIVSTAQQNPLAFRRLLSKMTLLPAQITAMLYMHSRLFSVISYTFSACNNQYLAQRLTGTNQVTNAIDPAADAEMMRRIRTMQVVHDCTNLTHIAITLTDAFIFGQPYRALVSAASMATVHYATMQLQPSTLQFLGNVTNMHNLIPHYARNLLPEVLGATIEKVSNVFTELNFPTYAYYMGKMRSFWLGSLCYYLEPYVILLDEVNKAIEAVQREDTPYTWSILRRKCKKVMTVIAACTVISSVSLWLIYALSLAVAINPVLALIFTVASTFFVSSYYCLSWWDAYNRISQPYQKLVNGFVSRLFADQHPHVVELRRQVQSMGANFERSNSLAEAINEQQHVHFKNVLSHAFDGFDQTQEMLQRLNQQIEANSAELERAAEQVHKNVQALQLAQNALQNIDTIERNESEQHNLNLQLVQLNIQPLDRARLGYDLIHLIYELNITLWQQCGSQQPGDTKAAILSHLKQHAIQQAKGELVEQAERARTNFDIDSQPLIFPASSSVNPNQPVDVDALWRASQRHCDEQMESKNQWLLDSVTRVILKRSFMRSMEESDTASMTQKEFLELMQQPQMLAGVRVQVEDCMAAAAAWRNRRQQQRQNADPTSASDATE